MDRHPPTPPRGPQAVRRGPQPTRQPHPASPAGKVPQRPVAPERPLFCDGQPPEGAARPGPPSRQPEWWVLQGLLADETGRAAYALHALLTEVIAAEAEAASVISFSTLHALLVPHLIGDSHG